MAASTFYYIPQRKTTTLATVGGIDASQTTGIKLTSVANVETSKPGIIAVNWSNPIDDTKIEYITYTSIDGNNELVGATRGAEDSTGRIHSNGVTIAFVVSASHVNEVAKALNGTNTGVTLNTPALTTPKITTSINDANGNEVIKTPATASAVNEITITNAAAGSEPTIESTGGDTDIDLQLKGKGAGRVKVYNGSTYVEAGGLMSTTQYAPQGFLINGKIVPSVTSNNLTVAIKGMDGNDPSASNPVYVRIGDTVRTITAALSVTKNAGTNWFNSGGTELATSEVDYFVYLGYNATDGVVIGFARIPFGTEYDSFSTTSTAETYCAISTITNAAAGDDYELIGRFAATLSAGAGYTWTVPTYTNKNLIQRPIFETRVLSGVSVEGGLTSNPSIYYQLKDRTLHFYGQTNKIGGTSDATTFTFTLPFANAVAFIKAVPVQDNTSDLTAVGWLNLTAGSSTVTANKALFSGGGWTASGVKGVYLDRLICQI